VFAERQCHDGRRRTLRGRDGRIVRGDSVLTTHRCYRSIGKRVFDVLVAAPLLVASAPLLLVSAAAILISSDGPVLFRQRRVGRAGVEFDILKLRTMTHTVEERRPTNEVRAGDSEVTSVGSILRRFKIDEVPQLWNVLIGDMSLVGPRPALPSQVSAYDEIARQRLAVRPGLTGLAQINGNIFLSWEERWKWDTEYVRRVSFALDLRILSRTLVVIVRGEAHRTRLVDG
jgi:undecaprenyl phosphate N,N'-diacetylbacillosamine 1-phosphate transferase